MPAQSDTRRVLKRVTEVIERVAAVREHGQAEVAWQLPFQLDCADEEVATADVVAGRVLRRQLVEAEAANAVVAAGEEPLRRGQFGEVRHFAHAQFAAHAQVPQVRQVEDPFALEAEADV